MEHNKRTEPEDEAAALDGLAAPGYHILSRPEREPGHSRLYQTIGIIFLLFIVIATSATVYVITAPAEGEHFTEFYVLDENGSAGNYPERFAAGDSQTVIIGIGNHEYRHVTYTVETWLCNQTFDPDTNTSTISDATLLDRWIVALPHNETVEQPYTFAANSTGYNRLEFLLFDRQVPPESTRGTARINESKRDLHLSIDVFEA
jgi:uncharacterized membrane protein